MTTINNIEYYSKIEAMEILEIGQSQLARLRISDNIKWFKVNKRKFLYEKESVDNYHINKPHFYAEKAKKFIGSQIGNFIILEFCGMKKQKSRVKAKCLTCNSENILNLSDIKTGEKVYQKNCALCLKGDKNPLWKGHGEISSSVWTRIKTLALQRDLEFSISIEYVWDLFLRQERKCALSGLDIGFNKKWEKFSASLDRIDSSKGYIEGNVQWTHKIINRMKNNFPENLFIFLCQKISKKNKDLSIDGAKEISEFEEYQATQALKREKLYRKVKLISEKGEEKVINGIKKYCFENNLSYNILRENFKKDNDKFHKGWKIADELTNK